MSPTASAIDRKHRQVLAVGQLLLLPLFGFIGAAWATGFPWVDPHYAFETRYLQYAAIMTSLCSGMAVAIAFWPTVTLNRDHLIIHLGAVVAALLSGHLFWVEPIWGFHHNYSLGIFAWLLLGFEDGFVIMPNPCGVPLTLGSFIACIVVLRAIVKKAHNKSLHPTAATSSVMESQSGGGR